MNIVTFGELMLRLSPPAHQRFVQAATFDVSFGGGEANVAVSLAQWGAACQFVSKLPAHEIGQAAVNALRRYGVGTRYLVRGGDRVGVYFLETGASQRGSKVIYDRAHAAVTTLRPGDIDWDAAFDGVDWFHWTGITPALGDGPRAVLDEACRAARRRGVTISADLNYRAKLWTVEQARSVMRPLMEYVDVCIANEEDADKSLGLTAAGTDVEAGQIGERGYLNLAAALRDTFGFKTVAITLRESFSASRNGWSGIICDGDAASTPYRSRQYDITLVDRVGGGDSFAAGLIYGLLTADSPQEALEFAVAASCLKQTIPGDFNHVSVEEVRKLASGKGSGRVER